MSADAAAQAFDTLATLAVFVVIVYVIIEVVEAAPVVDYEPSIDDTIEDAAGDLSGWM